MTLVLDCPGLTNIAVAAGYYAQMTSILAGFAFTAIVLLLSPTQIGERASNGRALDNGVLLALVAGFVALLLATLSFSNLAAETAIEARGRSAAQQIVCGVIFGLAVLMLFKGITLLLQAGNIDRVAVWTARVTTVVILPALTLFILTGGAMDSDRVRAASIAKTCTVTPAPLGLALSGALTVTLTLSLVPRLQPPLVRHWAQKLQNAVPITVLVCSVAAAAVSMIALGTRSPDFVLSPSALTWFFVSVFTLLLILGLMISFGFPDLKPSEAKLRLDNRTEVIPNV
jgi:hypothetical protein